MKKLLYFAAAVLAIAACQKEVGTQVVDTTPVKTHTVTIKAGFSEETKTAYDAQGKFSWVAGDKIGVVVANQAEEEQVVTFTTQDNGPVAEFTGEVPEGFEVSHYASYPYTQTYDGYACNDFVYEPEKKGFRLWGSVKPSLTDPLSCTPLLATKDADGFFQFSTATGIVKFTVVNVPVETYYAYLEIPSDKDKTQYNLNGWYAPTDDGIIEMATAVDPWQDRHNWNAPTGPNQTIDYYFFIPAGFIPEGSKFELCNSSWASVKSFPIVQAIEVKRNIITNVAPIEISSVTTYTLEDIIGTYDMKVSAGPYSSNNEPGDLVIEASDNSQKGNVMMTKFAGIPGKQYGTFNGATIVFPKDQIFGNNPYSDAETKPYVALDFYKGSVVDAEFTVLGRGQIRATGADAMGLRTCTEEDWQTYGGGWPWALCFSSIIATWKGTGPQQIALDASMVSVNVDAGSKDGSAHYDGEGPAALVDGKTSSFWHTPWCTAAEAAEYYPAVPQPVYEYSDLDATYGAYIDIDLGAENGVKDFEFTMCLRAADGNFPKHVILYGTNDKSAWGDPLADVANVCSGIASGAWINNITCNAAAAVRYIRVSIVENTSGKDLRDPAAQGCTHVAEIELYKL
ncbi:MAG: discoidin domain-containing protein [Bacteroidales bacterium]|nr:discoidin domain-containing protein [Bacteroidales bacterium]